MVAINTYSLTAAPRRYAADRHSGAILITRRNNSSEAASPREFNGNRPAATGSNFDTSLSTAV